VALGECGRATRSGGVRHERALPTAVDRANLLRFGEQVDVQVIGDGADGELTPERVAAYLAKYATKSAEDFGLGERRLSGLALAGVGVSAHVAHIVRTAWELGAADELGGLRRWLHMLGFRGHFATKSRRYSTTLGAIRRERSDYGRRQLADARPVGIEDQAGEDTTLVVGRWQFAGLGYLTVATRSWRWPRPPEPANGERPPVTTRTERREEPRWTGTRRSCAGRSGAGCGWCAGSPT
jgi:hypothetical protein